MCTCIYALFFNKMYFNSYISDSSPSGVTESFDNLIKEIDFSLGNLTRPYIWGSLSFMDSLQSWTEEKTKGAEQRRSAWVGVLRSLPPLHPISTQLPSSSLASWRSQGCSCRLSVAACWTFPYCQLDPSLTSLCPVHPGHHCIHCGRRLLKPTPPSHD